MKKNNNPLIHLTLCAMFLLISACNLPRGESSGMNSVTTRYVEWQQTLTPGLPGTDGERIEPTYAPPRETAPISDHESLEEPLKVFFHPGVPERLIHSLNLPDSWQESNETDADMRIMISSKDQTSDNSIGGTWIYALVAPFYTIDDGITSEALSSLWQGQVNEGFPFNRISLTAESYAVLQVLFGPPDNTVVNIVTSEELNNLTLTNQPTLSVVPLDELEPYWKVIRVDGQSPIDDQFSPDEYPLSLDIWVEGQIGDAIILDNYDPQLRTVLIITGVTALTRATAYRMEIHGNTYPGRDTRAWFSAADLVHISNEVPFAENCPYPNSFQSDLIFCSSPDRIELLEYIDASIIELSGNHMLDYGISAMNLTLEMYAERGWETFAGGWDLADSRSPALVNHNGNQLAFIGCNPAGPPYSWATETQPGSTPCGDYQWMLDEIRSLRSMGYLPIVTLQYVEDYTAYPSAKMVADFQRLAEVGAVMVSGSQAHTPKTMVFHQGSFLHFGLGNLFFDQMEVYYGGYLMQGTREAFLDRLIFYDGRLISIELLTTMLEDYARPRPMTTLERNALLSRIFPIALNAYE